MGTCKFVWRFKCLKWILVWLLLETCGAHKDTENAAHSNEHQLSDYDDKKDPELAPYLEDTPPEFMTSALPPDETSVGCLIPKLEPWAEDIKHVFNAPNPLNCTEDYPLLFNSTLNSHSIYPVKSTAQMLEMNISSCCYTPFQRGVDEKDPDNVVSYSNHCYPISFKGHTSVSPEHEFIAIKCIEKDKQRIMDMHAFVHLKPEVEARVTQIRKMLPHQDSVNVVLFGIDSTSHMNFIRQMPTAHRYLISDLGAVEMQGFNKVGENTLPNMLATLSSLRYNKSSETAPCEVDDAYDNCPFIWNRFKKVGYRTFLAEDSATMMIFNWAKLGFRHPPTDYYFRSFARAAQDEIGTHDRGTWECYGPRTEFETLCSYMKKIAVTMGQRRFFQLIWATSLTHTDVNEAAHGDKHLKSLLEWYKNSAYFDNAVFIFMSDHGNRWGKIVEYAQGRLEDRMPFLYYVTPHWFQKKYSRAITNLRTNAERLTTPFDVYETMADLLDLSRLENGRLTRREHGLKSKKLKGRLPRGISHFLPIPLSRTCRHAWIETHYCTCHTRRQVPVTSDEVKHAVKFTVRHINSLFSNRSECAQLSVGDISSAQLLGITTETGNDTDTYQIVFTTMPGGALFDVGVVRQGGVGWKLTGSIGRINRYGRQSHCVKEKNLKAFCYCVDLLTY